MPKKKPFIDKANAITFRLVHRSQRDPLVADEKAPQRVLVETKSAKSKETERGSTSHSFHKNETEVRKEEQRKYGIFFDDEYDYLQHLKNPEEVTIEPIAGDFSKFLLEEDASKSLKLPSSVFASGLEEKIGLLNRAAPIPGPKPDWDPDIVAALDSDDDELDELEDDFVLRANAAVSSEDENSVTSKDDDVESDTSSACRYGARMSDDDDYDHSFDEVETKSRFTNYSMSSSVIKRNEGLTLLDDRFEKVYEEYDEDQIGPLDGEDMDGFLKPGNPLLESIIESYQRQQVTNKLTNLRDEARIVTEDREESSSEEELDKIIFEEPAEKWDCESIISTYSNLYNHPKLIKEPTNNKPIKISAKTGIPEDVLKSKGISSSDLKALDGEKGSPLSGRDKHETSEEKRNRKRLVKEQRKERRIEKKANSIAFKEEKKRQLQNNLVQNIKNIKIA